MVVINHILVFHICSKPIISSSKFTKEMHVGLLHVGSHKNNNNVTYNEKMKWEKSNMVFIFILIYNKIK